MLGLVAMHAGAGAGGWQHVDARLRPGGPFDEDQAVPLQGLVAAMPSWVRRFFASRQQLGSGPAGLAGAAGADSCVPGPCDGLRNHWGRSAAKGRRGRPLASSPNRTDGLVHRRDHLDALSAMAVAIARELDSALVDFEEQLSSLAEALAQDPGNEQLLEVSSLGLGSWGRTWVRRSRPTGPRTPARTPPHPRSATSSRRRSRRRAQRSARLRARTLPRAAQANP